MLEYNTESRELSVVMENLRFPNGIQLLPDEESVLVAETTMARIRRYRRRVRPDCVCVCGFIFFVFAALVPAFARFNQSLLCQGPRGGPEQRWDGELHGQPAWVPRQHSAQFERRLLGGHVCREAQPRLLHAGLSVPETLD